MPVAPSEKLTFDTSRFPLVTFTQVGAVGMAEIKYNLACYQEVFARKERFVAVFDARRAERHDPSLNAVYADVFKVIRQDMRVWCAGLSYVMDTVLLRMALRGLLFLLKPPMPYAVHATIEEGERWCFEQLKNPPNTKA